MKSGSLLALGATLAAGALLAGCYHGDDGNDDGGMTPVTQTTVGDLAVGQTTTKTCAQGTPDPINALTIVDSDAAVDVSTLEPGCSGS